MHENFVERNDVYERTANGGEFDSQKSSAKAKDDMAECISQLDSLFGVEIMEMLLGKCTAEQILKSMNKAVVDNVLHGTGYAIEITIYALEQAESNRQLQQGTVKRWSASRRVMVLNAIRTIQQDVFNSFEDYKHIEDPRKTNLLQTTSLILSGAAREGSGLLEESF